MDGTQPSKSRWDTDGPLLDGGSGSVVHGQFAMPAAPDPDRVFKAVRDFATHQAREAVYRGVHMRGSVWPSRRTPPPADPNRPMTKREKFAYRDRVRTQISHGVAEGESRLVPIADPRKTRGFLPVASPRAVEHWLGQYTFMDAGELVSRMGGGMGLMRGSDIEAHGRRANRYLSNAYSEGGRVPGHILDKAVMSSAMVQALAATFPDALPPEAVAASHELAVRAVPAAPEQER